MLREYMKYLGYKEKDIDKIVNNHSLNGYIENNLLLKIADIYTYLLKVGYSRGEIVKITKKNPTIYSFDINNLNDKIKNLLSIGYTNSDVRKIILKYPSILGYSSDNINNRIDELISLGYKKEDIIKMTKILPNIYCYSMDNITSKIIDLIYMGYSRCDVIDMTIKSPGLYSTNIKNIRNKFVAILKHGYSRKDVINMTRLFPQLYSLNIETTGEKLAFYNDIGFHDFISQNATCLMQSIELSYARYKFLEEYRYKINYKNLFLTNKDFERRYRISREKLLNRYNYQDYKIDMVREKKC